VPQLLLTVRFHWPLSGWAGRFVPTYLPNMISELSWLRRNMRVSPAPFSILDTLICLRRSISLVQITNPEQVATAMPVPKVSTQ
jgi:hypothetical protein